MYTLFRWFLCRYRLFQRTFFHLTEPEYDYDRNLSKLANQQQIVTAAQLVSSCVCDEFDLGKFYST